MLSSLRNTTAVLLTLPLFAGCGTLNTGHRDLDRTFNKAQTATEKPASCCVVAGLTGLLGWLWFTNDGTVEYDSSAPKGEKVSLGFEHDHEPDPGQTQVYTAH
jgi:hypothetical protein